MTNLEFELPIIELEAKIEELRRLSTSSEVNITDEVSRLEKRIARLIKDVYAKLTPAQKVQVARHPSRPHAKDYIKALVTDYQPLAGDRHFGEDSAIIGGIGRIGEHAVVIMGQERGSDTESRVKHNFGMAMPEGYRKAQRLIALAERFNLPVVTLVDTAGAYPGVGAEERGQAEAIAKSIETCLRARVPLVSIVIGEGGSGGAIAIAAANKIFMLEHAIYSVISPEGCASILWRSAQYAAEAAAALRLTAQDLKKLGIIDDIISEEAGGAHRNRKEVIEKVGKTIKTAIEELSSLSGDEIVSARQEKFLKMGDKGL